MPVYKVLGDRIKKIRLENNMTQQDFAEALGYTHKSMINKIETGQTDMSFDKVIALILTFRVNAAEFLDLSSFDMAFGLTTVALCSTSLVKKSYSILPITKLVKDERYKGWCDYLDKTSNGKVLYLNSLEDIS